MKKPVPIIPIMLAMLAAPAAQAASPYDKYRAVLEPLPEGGIRNSIRVETEWLRGLEGISASGRVAGRSTTRGRRVVRAEFSCWRG